ncbi:hypothetical protein C8Q76DRAFT_426367 [Earliella scabrosa]|nr:hypothetical protein C8Q76DRAFT_426367 [Earliella scabrosa]
MTLPPTRLHPRQGATTVRCLPGSEWMRNSKDQTPCLVASWAIVPCRGTNGEPWVIGPIHPGGPFLGPSPTSDLFQCRCNTVFYSLLAACGACQGYHGQDGIQNLTVHMSPCPPGLLVHREYPQEIRPETAIPAWAYLDIVNDQWDEQGAIALALQGKCSGQHPCSGLLDLKPHGPYSTAVESVLDRRPARRITEPVRIRGRVRLCFSYS